ncbi:O-methyltransferase [Paenibacillus macerans]|uniref:O-methyltransferase n=1 Tax=Paenibacillus macerans TaxID=44252 RepID=A0A6N8EVE8_PAEMA|nr:class I SAM-dependent methyltransferase [Paenibacillus macerans]MUG22411.1 O-methyltransferase [Paenibacillus macerans]UMV49174.1 class I SAM-dependent methyltransferase [Paenibacillus macerans]GBK65291.1 caffeoyl-CoA O-methyltransferase [Paenibacillus macerans]GBK71532.1 caffeoyl-CoA O-methyltransferase [Paenibacillus macerans]GIP09556.1 caffeoyl-CoA O-methyltransferase [Paenibacillus macerans]
MFHNIPERIKKKMLELEQVNILDQEDGTERVKRLRQIPPETGKLISLLLASAPEGNVLEIGTSGGYSTLWLAMACQLKNRQLHTFEIEEVKIQIARETFAFAGLEELVQLETGDALTNITKFDEIGFCFCDLDKEFYDDIYNFVLPRLVSGGLFIADDVISHSNILQTFVDKVLCDPCVDALVIPINKGVLLARKL